MHSLTEFALFGASTHYRLLLMSDTRSKNDQYAWKSGFECSSCRSSVDDVSMISLRKVISDVSIALHMFDYDSGTTNLTSLLEITVEIVRIRRKRIPSIGIETFVSLMPYLIQIKEIILMHKSSTALFTEWLALCSTIMQLLQEDHDRGKNSSAIMLSRLFEVDHERGSVESIITTTLVRSENIDCRAIKAILGYLSTLEVCSKTSNIGVKERLTYYIRNITNFLFLCPAAISSGCISTLTLLNDFVGLQKTDILIDKNIFENFLFSKFIFSVQSKQSAEITMKIADIIMSQAKVVDDGLIQFLHSYMNPNDLLEKTLPPSESTQVPKLNISEILKSRSIRVLPSPTSTPTLDDLVNEKIIQLIFKFIFYPKPPTVLLENIPTGFMTDLFRFVKRTPSIAGRLESWLISNKSEIACRIFLNNKFLPNNLKMIGTGQFGSVFLDESNRVVYKLIPMDTTDPVKSGYNEALVMSSFPKKSEFLLSLLDCGSVLESAGTVSAIFISSDAYNGSLRAYRTALMDAVLDGLITHQIAIVILLVIYSQILAGVDTLHSSCIIHYDLKMDNILVHIPGRESFQDAARRGMIPKIAIADFGEARIASLCPCFRNRGTECIKAPEMLSIARHPGRIKTTTSACDIWSLGSLLFELVTGEYLFASDGDWFDFYYRVTGEDEKYPHVIDQGVNMKIGDDRLVGFLREILVRDPARRPTINGIIRKFQNIYSEYLNDETNFPKHQRLELPSSIPGTVRIKMIGP